MLISVIPTTKSHGTRPYPYRVHTPWIEQIKIGNLIEIPYGKDVLLAIVSEIIPEERYAEYEGISDQIRPILSVVSSNPLVTNGTLATVASLAERYFLPIHKALSLFLPQALMNRLEKRNYLLDS